MCIPSRIFNDFALLCGIDCVRFTPSEEMFEFADAKTETGTMLIKSIPITKQLNTFSISPIFSSPPHRHLSDFEKAIKVEI